MHQRLDWNTSISMHGILSLVHMSFELDICRKYDGASTHAPKARNELNSESLRARKLHVCSSPVHQQADQASRKPRRQELPTETYDN